MEENSELEEGEACSYKDDTDHIDPDADLSYIDERIEVVLGCHRRDFEGGVSAENLGAKYGGYGSFLPTYERSPAVLCHPKSPQSSFTALGSPSSFPMEGASQNFRPTPDAPFVGFSMNRGLQISPAQVPKKISMKDESLNKPANQTDQRSLKFRLKVGSDKLAQKKAELYSGLGLLSPSPSLENSAEESGAKNPASQENADESLTCILQVMTSFPVRGDVLISPLHENLLCLSRKESLSRNNKPGESCVKLEGQSQSGVGNGKQLKEKKSKSLGKGKRPLELPMHGTNLKHESVPTRLVKTKVENETPVGEASKVLREAVKDEVRDKLSLADLGPENSLESVSDSGKNPKGKVKVCLSQQVGEQRVMFSNSPNHALGYLGDNNESKDVKVYASLEARSDESKCIEDRNGGAVAPPKKKVSKKSLTHVEDGSKRSKVSQSSGKVAAVSLKGTSGDITDAKAKDSLKIKVRKLKLQKGENKARDMHRVPVDADLEQANNQLERLSSDRQRDSTLRTFEVKGKDAAVMNKVKKEKFGGKKVDNHGAAAIKDRPITGNDHASEVAPTAVHPVFFEENWVCCDRCEKWRVLPYVIKPDQLPDKWLCSMLNWLPEMNRCDISQDETTKATYALYPHPVSEGQSNLQNHAHKEVPITNSASGQYPDQKHQSLSSPAVSVPGKRKTCLKEISKEGSRLGQVHTSNLRKNQLQDCVKSKSLNETSKPISQSNIMRKSDSLHLKQKGKDINRGEVKRLKVKNKGDVNVYGRVASKKTKVDELYAADKHTNSDLDQKPSAGLQSNTTAKIKPKYELSHSEEPKCDNKDRLLISIKKLGDRVQVSSAGGSLGRRVQDKEFQSVKKRKWEETENEHEKDEEYAKEESSEARFGRQKESKVHLRDRGVSKGSDGKSGKKAKVTPPIDGSEGKHYRKVVSRQTFDDMIKGGIGGGELSVAATSSSSKVSGFRKHRATLEDMRGSPVGSVSSSPIRTTYRDKFRSTSEEFFGKDDDRIKCLPANGSRERYWDGEHQQYFDEQMGNQNNHENMSFPQKANTGSLLQLKDGDRSSISDVDRAKFKVSGPLSMCADLYPDKSMKHILVKNFDHHAPCHEIKSDDGDSFRERSRSNKGEKIHINGRDLERPHSKEGKVDMQLVRSDNDYSNVKLSVVTNRKAALKQHPMRDFDDEKVIGESQIKKRNTLKLDSHCESEDGQKARGHELVSASQRKGVSDDFHIEPNNVDMSKTSTKPGNVDKNGSTLGHCTPNLHGIKDINAPNPKSMKFSSHNINNTLKEAKRLKNHADHKKSSGFEFEGNEAYLDAAIKFLHGAWLLETCSGGSGKYGEMTQIQEYSIAAKLCESCAREYERRQEMAAAALAYKCMEVAYMRIVYCKSYSLNRDRNELQATFNVAPQGESPSSSASDVDNLNNQVAADKTALLKGTVPHVTGNPMIPARNRPNVIRLLDFTHEVSSGMEASKKSQNAFAVASINLEESQNRELITTLKKVIDFSFQDVEELIGLVQLAKEAISSSGFHGAKK